MQCNRENMHDQYQYDLQTTATLPRKLCPAAHWRPPSKRRRLLADDDLLPLTIHHERASYFIFSLPGHKQHFSPHRHQHHALLFMLVVC